jgi:hypothetical protein
MMTPEKVAMADISGGKRDRRSDDADQPNTTPNTRLTELSCWDEDGATGKDTTVEMMKNEEVPFLDPPKTVNKALGQVQNGMLPTDSVNAGPGAEIFDVDALICSGGLEIDDDEIVPGNTPQKLFSSFDDALDSLDDDEVKDAEPKVPTDETCPAPASLLNDNKKNDNSVDNDDAENKQKQKQK